MQYFSELDEHTAWAQFRVPPCKCKWYSKHGNHSSIEYNLNSREARIAGLLLDQRGKVVLLTKRGKYIYIFFFRFWSWGCCTEEWQQLQTPRSALYVSLERSFVSRPVSRNRDVASCQWQLHLSSAKCCEAQSQFCVRFTTVPALWIIITAYIFYALLSCLFKPPAGSRANSPSGSFSKRIVFFFS